MSKVISRQSHRIFLLFIGLGTLNLGIWTASAVDRITASIVCTNGPTTNGVTFSVTTTSSTTRTFTNSVQISATQVLTNLTGAGTATNLSANLIANPPAGVVPLLTGTSNITLYANSGLPLTINVTAGFFSITYATQAVTSAYTVRVPYTVEAAAQKTNVSSGLVEWLNYSGITNQLGQTNPAMAQLMGTTNTQTIAGSKSFTNAAGIWKGIISNSPAISGYVAALTNGSWSAGNFDNPSMTNAANYGNAFRSPGSGISSEQIGDTATATGLHSVAFGPNSTAADTDTTSIGYNTTASTESATAIGSGAKALSTNSTALGKSAFVSFSHSAAFGANATPTAEHQVRLGTSSEYVSIPGGLRVDGFQTNAIYSGTNNFPAGSDIAFGRFSVTSLANGNNAAVPVGTNVFIEVSGPSSTFTINGINAATAQRDGKLIYIVNQTGFDMTIAHQSGTDPTAANRIITMTGADRTTTGNGAATLIYSGAASRWILISFDP